MTTVSGTGVGGWQRDLVAAAQLTANVQSSHDAVIGKDLTSVSIWNPGPGRLYTAGMA